MIKITPLNNYCVLEPQGPLSGDDFTAIANQIDPIIEHEGHLDGLIIKTRRFPGWEGLGDVVEHFRFIGDHHRVIKKIALVTDAKSSRFFQSLWTTL
jgi:hypothetical protein